MLYVDLTTAWQERGRHPHGTTRVERGLVAAFARRNDPNLAFVRRDGAAYLPVTPPDAIAAATAPTTADLGRRPQPDWWRHPLVLRARAFRRHLRARPPPPPPLPPADPFLPDATLLLCGEHDRHDFAALATSKPASPACSGPCAGMIPSPACWRRSPHCPGRRSPNLGSDGTGSRRAMSILWHDDDHREPSVFRPDHLLREARRQRRLPEHPVPPVCVLDPDGDLPRHLRRSGRARPSQSWACYHTEMLEFPLADGTTAGIIACAVGAPFAVLVAEQLFASGCRLLVSITSSGRIADLGDPPYTILIDAALRDEGTSARYLPRDAGPFVAAPNPDLLRRVEAATREAVHPAPLHRGTTWTTDAPYRETESAIDAARHLGALAVEMEAAALYAFAAARAVPVVCFAQVTNTMGQHGGDDFEKGEADGALLALRLIEATARALHPEEAMP